MDSPYAFASNPYRNRLPDISLFVNSIREVITEPKLLVNRDSSKLTRTQNKTGDCLTIIKCMPETNGNTFHVDDVLNYDINVPGTFTGMNVNRENIGKTRDELVTKWNTENPDDQVSFSQS